MEQRCKTWGDCSSLPLGVGFDELSSRCMTNGSHKMRRGQLADEIGTTGAGLNGGNGGRLSWGKMRDP